jgi:hypothetical protein
MAPTIKYRDHPTAGNTPEQRIAARLRPSAGVGAGDVQTTTGSGPNRVVHTIRHAGSAGAHPASQDGPMVGRKGPTSPLTAGRGRDE